MHELFHAKQTDISAETNRHVAEEMGFQYDENVHSRNVDNIHLENMAIRKLLAGELPDEYKRGALYNLNNAYYSYDKVWDEVRSTDDNEPFGFSPYYSQILEVEAYSFGAQVRERLLSARQPELRKTATEADRQKAEEVRKEAIARLFSPQDMLLVEDFINDPATDFRELDGIANYLTGSRRIEYLRRGAEMENDASGITIPDNANTKDPVFRRAYFRQCVKCGIDSRISDINTNVFMNAYEAGSEPETVIGDFFDMISLEMADNPRRGGDMALVALDATVNRDSYDSGAIFDQLDGITRRAKRSIKERMRYALNKRRFQKAHQSA